MSYSINLTGQSAFPAKSGNKKSVNKTSLFKHDSYQNIFSNFIPLEFNSKEHNLAGIILIIWFSLLLDSQILSKPPVSSFSNVFSKLFIATGIRRRISLLTSLQPFILHEAPVLKLVKELCATYFWCKRRKKTWTWIFISWTFQWLIEWEGVFRTRTFLTKSHP